MDAGQYERAADDLQKAIALRDTDQLWARTYGLHFMREYFPSRELGIVLYHQGLLEESTARLEESIQQQFSARAAHYIDNARRAIIARNGTDQAPPRASIDTPGQGEALHITSIELTGTATDDTFVSSIEVDGKEVDVRVAAPEVPFAVEVPVLPGKNAWRVRVTDLSGKSSESTVELAADLDGPVISFNTPVVIPGMVSGVAFDPAGVTAVEIAGEAAELTPGVDGALSFRVPVNHAQDPAAFVASDALGNETRGVVPVDALAVTASGAMMPASFSRHSAQSAPTPIVYVGRQAYLLLAANAVDGVSVDMPEVLEGQAYYMDEIVVNVEVRSPEPITEISLNGAPLPVIPGRTAQRVSRRVRLDQGPNSLEARATAAGEVKTATRTVERAISELDAAPGRLAIGLLEPPPDSLGDLAGLAERICHDFLAAPAVTDRFTVVDRARLQAILMEQELSAELSNRQQRLALGRVVPADLLLEARVRREGGTIEIVLDGTSTETGVRLASHVDVCGPADELDQLIADLAVRLAQAFPRAQGMVLDWAAPEVVMDLTARQGVRPYYKCLVYRTEEVLHPVTGASLGARPIVICEGTVQTVGEQFSSAEATLPEGETEAANLVIEPGYAVILK
jgi:hypothetical protein